jgi:hypothetical protein
MIKYNKKMENRYVHSALSPKLPLNIAMSPSSIAPFDIRPRPFRVEQVEQYIVIVDRSLQTAYKM